MSTEVKEKHHCTLSISLSTVALIVVVAAKVELKCQKP